MQVDLLDWRLGEELLEYFFLIYGARRRVETPD